MASRNQTNEGNCDLSGAEGTQYQPLTGESPSFSRSERERVIRDIAGWKLEVDYETFVPSKYDTYLKELVALSDAALRRHWHQTVGEWLLGQVGMDGGSSVDGGTEPWVSQQFQRCKAGEPVPWDYSLTPSLAAIADEFTESA